MDNDLAQLTTKLGELGDKIEKDLATKAEVRNFADAFSAMQKKLDNDKDHQEKVSKIFTKSQARDFLGHLGGLLEKTNFNFGSVEKDRHGLSITKSDLNGSSGNGLSFVPTSVNGTLDMLLSQNSIARRESTVYDNLRGDYVLTKRNGHSTAAFTAAQNTAVTPASLTETKMTLSPKQMCAISKVSNQLLWNSAVNVATAVAIDLTEQAGMLEDNSVIRGDGTAAFGTIYGLNDGTPAIPTQAIANAAAFTTVDSLLQLKYTKVHESVRNSGKFYVSGAVFGLIAAMKASTAGTYYYDITSQTLKLSGSDIVIWDRMDSALTAGKYIAYFGDMSKAVSVGTGRGISIELSEQRYWDSNEVGFKLVQDFHAVVLQPTAIAAVTVTA